MSFSSEFEEHHALVIHTGSRSIQVGFSGEDIPFYIDSNVIGTTGKGDSLVGAEALKRGTDVKLKFPIRKGMIHDFSAMESVWSHVFYSQLKIEPSNYPILLTEAPLNPISIRERTTQIMFEVFNVPAYYTAIHCVLSLYANGVTTGTVLETGHEVCFITPIYEGYALPHAIKTLSIGGKHIDDRLEEVFTSRGYNFETPIEKAMITHIKESRCFVVLDKNNTRNTQLKDTNYLLPNGRTICLDRELYETPELFFEDTEKNKALPKSCHESIQACDVDIRYELYNNVVLAGGSCLLKGFVPRFEKELLAFSKHGRVKNKDLKYREYSAWIGGSILTSLSTFQCMYISKSEYEESGPNIVNRKCF